MNKREIQDIKDNIKMYKKRLSTIQPHLSPEKYTLNETFNKLLVEKAILRDKLTNKAPTFFNKLLRKLNANKRELICDYFK
jgi:predicted RNase H-like nuclease (RuvC/YqgF family)